MNKMNKACDFEIICESPVIPQWVIDTENFIKNINPENDDSTYHEFINEIWYDLNDFYDDLNEEVKNAFKPNDSDNFYSIHKSDHHKNNKRRKYKVKK
jgi:hypothetical protein